MKTALVALLVGAMAVATALSVALLPMFDGGAGYLQPLEPITAALWVAFAGALVLLRRVPRRAVVALVLAGSAAIGVASMAGEPNTSTDSARYAWDGIVQTQGISPYRYVPADATLTPLRPDWLFPAPATNADGALYCPTFRIMYFTEVGTGATLCSAINRAESPTIYPPVAEFVFAAERFVVGPQAQYWPVQLTGLLTSLAITALLLRELVRRGRDPRWAAMWGWCPLVATEAVTNAHIDIVGTLLLVIATIAVSRGRRIRGGIALGAAVATKLIPAIGAPALLGRKPWGLVAAAVGTFLVVYVPYVLADGSGVLGYLPAYLKEEGFESGGRSILFSLVLPGAAATIAAALVILGTAVAVWWRSRPTDPWLGQVVMIGVTLVAISPRYSWYALMLVPMIAMTGRWEWLAIPLALTENFLYEPVGWARLALVLAVLVVAAISIRRAGPNGFVWARAARIRSQFGARAHSD